jgi:hypothetical protein
MRLKNRFFDSFPGPFSREKHLHLKKTGLCNDDRRSGSLNQNQDSE